MKNLLIFLSSAFLVAHALADQPASESPVITRVNPDLKLNYGDRIHLECNVRHSKEARLHLDENIWNFRTKNYDFNKEQFLNIFQGDRMHKMSTVLNETDILYTLTIENAVPMDEGFFTCAIHDHVENSKIINVEVNTADLSFDHEIPSTLNREYWSCRNNEADNSLTAKKHLCTKLPKFYKGRIENPGNEKHVSSIFCAALFSHDVSIYTDDGHGKPISETLPYGKLVTYSNETDFLRYVVYINILDAPEVDSMKCGFKQESTGVEIPVPLYYTSRLVHSGN